ncbi:radical SAM protein [Candidatus Pacearchaeota archaeon]|nr:radical SAM protein [Candidatus Pacearchaeota archaeon]
MRLEEIGFYTLEEKRAKEVSSKSPMWRCEILLTDKCNFSCPYCRGIRKDCVGEQSLPNMMSIINTWSKDNLRNIRFSGGEPTLYPHLIEAVRYARDCGIKRIAISTNGYSLTKYYLELINAGVNDISISLDACCSSFGDKMAGGIKGAWDVVVENIKILSKFTYVTVGIVLTEDTINQATDIIKFSHDLGVADIRLLSASQYNVVIPQLENISQDILNSHPILKYRVNHFLNGRNVRGISENDCHKCYMVLDDSAIAGKYHFPCIIYLREGGNPIGKVNPDMRRERILWHENHNSYSDSICRKNCLDVCIDYNNKVLEYRKEIENEQS